MIRGLMLIGVLLAGQVAPGTGEDSPAAVRRLVRQLDAPQLAQREAAEAELLRCGPAVLELLPTTTDRLPAEVQQRLGRIRQRLQQAAANAATDASTITLHADATPLSKILAAFQEQSGNAIVDYRRQFGQPATDPTLTIRFDKTPFWPAMDRLLDEARLTLYPYAQPGAIGVVAAAGATRVARLGHASYRGPFRFEAVRIVARRDPREADGRSLEVTLEAAWEPRLRIICLLHRMADVQAVDEARQSAAGCRPRCPTGGSPQRRSPGGKAGHTVAFAAARSAADRRACGASCWPRCPARSRPFALPSSARRRTSNSGSPA